MSAILQPSTIVPVTNPRLSVRTAALFLRLPAVQQMKILHDQKYPKQAPQVFRQPYYQPALHGIRGLLENGAAALDAARAQIQSIPQPSRRMHSMRVLEQFAGSEHAHRALRPAPHKRLYAAIGGLELRLSPDLIALEGDEERFIYFNFKAEQYDAESAKMTNEIAHWLLEENGLEVKPKQIEFIDLFTGVLYKLAKRRKRTIALLAENAKLIENLWPAIEP